MPNDRRIRALVDDNLRLVRHTLIRVGVPRSDLDDEVQRTFIVAARRIDDVEPGAERSFLIQVARNIGWHWHRSRSRRREVPSDLSIDVGVAPGTPEETTLRMEARMLLDQILAALPEPLRAVFVSFELDGLNMQQIASQLGIPRGTVASRMRRARKRVKQNVAAIDLAWELGVDGAAANDEPVVLRRRSLSALAHALLESGASTPRRADIRAKILAACLGLIPREAGTGKPRRRTTRRR
jgi:RNA polymerase sigma-70 factor (ECF subfamily)